MTATELSAVLAKMFSNAPIRATAMTVHLFAIIHEREIRACGVPTREIVRLAGIPYSNLTEVYRGLKLAYYVKCRPGVSVPGLPS